MLKPQTQVRIIGGVKARIGLVGVVTDETPQSKNRNKVPVAINEERVTGTYWYKDSDLEPILLVDLAESNALVSVEVVQFQPLTFDEQRDRENLERKIEKSFFVAGQALKELRDRRLYRSTHISFESYCRDRFQFTRDSAYLKIAAADIYQNLEKTMPALPTIGRHQNDVFPLPTSERQLRHIAKASLEPAEQVEVWQAAVEVAEGKIPSGRIVKDIVDRIREKTKVPNPWRINEIAEITVKENLDLKGLGGCWCIITEVREFGCLVQMWSGDRYVKIENLKSLDLSPSQQQEVRLLCARLNRLCAIESLDRSAKILLSNLGKQTFLTPVEEQLLQTLETFYNVCNEN